MKENLKATMQKFFQTLRGVFFVIREKEPTKYRVVRRTPKKDLPAGIISDETIRLSASIALHPATSAAITAFGGWHKHTYIENHQKKATLSA